MSALLPSLLLLLLVVSIPTLASASTYTIDSSTLGLPFDGIGALSAGASSRLLPDYIEPYRSHVLDYLFLPSFGASLHILKVEIGGDAQSTEGTEASHMHIAEEENYERGYEWWLMKQAKQRNPSIKLYGLSWGFPYFVMENQQHGSGLPLTNTTVHYITKWLIAARDIHNLTIDYIGIWNERAYSSAYIVALHASLRSHDLSTLIVAADDCCPPWDICNDMLSDAAMSAAVTYIGGSVTTYHSARSHSWVCCSQLEFSTMPALSPMCVLCTAIIRISRQRRTVHYCRSVSGVVRTSRRSIPPADVGLDYSIVITCMATSLLPSHGVLSRPTMTNCRTAASD